MADYKDPKGDETHALRWVIQQIQTRGPVAAKAWRFYEGTQEERFTLKNPRIARALARASRDMRVNLARTPVTAVVDRLHVEQWLASDNQDALDEMAEDQDLDGLAYEVHERTEAMGTAYGIVWPDGMSEMDDVDEEGNPITVELADGVVLSLHDPTDCVVKYDDEHRTEVEYAGRMWRQDDDRHRVNVYHQDRVERWLEKEKGADLYELLPEDADLPGVWEYPDSMVGTVPVFQFRTNRTDKGRPGHADAIPVQTIIDKLVATDAALVDYAGFPIRYMVHKGDPTASAGYDDPELDDEDVDATEGEGRQSRLSADPGVVWDIDADAVGEFAAADPAVILERMSHYTRALLSVSDTPLSEWEGLGANASGESRRQEQRTLVRKVKRRQGLHGRSWAAMLSYALQAEGHADVMVEVQWTDAAELDDTEAWEATAAKVTAGLPLYQALTEHGYDEDQLAAWGITERTVLTASEMGQLLQRLAAASTILGDDDVANILEAYGVDITGRTDDPEQLPPTPPVPAQLVPPEPEPEG